jgi:hypothetical protein
MKRLILPLLLFGTFLIQAQDIPIGSWREHLPYSRGESVAELDNTIYCATGQGLFSYDKQDQSMLRMSKVNGLSDVGIRSLASHKDLQILVIAYENANIDLLRNNRLLNLPDIKRKTALGKKEINRVIFRSNMAYLACGFGIVVLDLEKEEFFDTYLIGPSGSQVQIFDITFNDSLILAASEHGIYQARLDAQNLADYNSWTLLPSPAAPIGFSALIQHHGMLFTVKADPAGSSDTLLVLNAGNWSHFANVSKRKIYGLKVFRDQLMVISEGDVDLYDDQGSLVERIYTYSPGVPSPHDAIIGSDNLFWISDLSLGLVRCYNTWNCQSMHPEGPGSINNAALAFSGNKLWIAPGGVNYSWNNFYRTEGLFSFNGSTWQNYNRNNTPAFDSIFDILSLAVDPSDPTHVFAGSWGNGLVEMKAGKVHKVHNASNSSLKSAASFYFVGIAGMTFDSKRNLWVSNSYQPYGLSMLSPTGTWTSFNLSPVIAEEILGNITIDNFGQKWVVLPRGSGILVFDENDTPEIPGDDKKRKLSTAAGNGNLPSSNVLCLTRDLDGEIWVGTDKGVVVFYSPGNVFSGNNFDAQKVLVEYDGYNQYLLESENVTCIAVDGANRKWIGTERAGVFLLSEDGTRELMHFSAANSPLLSDNISSIAIDQESGEVFFGTDKGVVSYRSTATAGTEQHSETYAFPNPVPPDYDGLIAIRGLVEQADVKITDIAGNVVYAGKALGGQAVWDGRNLKGEKVQTGVYLVFSVNGSETGFSVGEEKMVSKILFIK